MDYVAGFLVPWIFYGGEKWRRLVSRDGWVSYAHPINLRFLLANDIHWERVELPLQDGICSWKFPTNHTTLLLGWFFGREYSFKQFTIKIYPSQLKCWDVGRHIARFLHSKAGHVWIAKIWSHWSAGRWFLSRISIQKRWEVWEVWELVRRDIETFHAIITHRQLNLQLGQLTTESWDSRVIHTCSQSTCCKPIRFKQMYKKQRRLSIYWLDVFIIPEIEHGYPKMSYGIIWPYVERRFLFQAITFVLHPKFSGCFTLVCFFPQKLKVWNESEDPKSVVIEVLLNSLVMMMVSWSSVFWP